MARESDYYIWLCGLVGNREDYEYLLKQLDNTEFKYQLVLDENRAEGGKSLRGIYADENSMYEDDIRSGPCTVLEMLIRLADHMTDTLAGTIEDWFWQLLDNIGLSKFDDYHYDPRGVSYILDVWLNRSYKSNGKGSIFPLKDYSGDCRFLDIWSQMNAWINENYPANTDWLA